MKIRSDEEYEEVAAEYQFQLIGLLDAALETTSLSKGERREVCERFTFDMGMRHDQGEVTVEGQSWFPTLAFRAGDDLLLPNAQFALHEYAEGNVAEHFEAGGGAN